MSGWGTKLQHTLRDFAGGLITSVEPDLLPPQCLTEATNIQLLSVGAGAAVIGQRPGWRREDDSAAFAGTPPWMASHVHRYADGTQVALLQDSIGQLPSVALPLGSGDALEGRALPALASAPERPFFAISHLDSIFLCNGGNVFSGVSEDQEGTAFRIRRPDFPTTAADLLFARMGIPAPAAPVIHDWSGSMPAGTYDVAYTYYNTVTGSESSRSPAASVTLTIPSGIKVDVGITTANWESDRIRVYLRNQRLNGSFYLAATAQVGHVDVYLDVSDDEFNELDILAPTTTSNDPPPTGIRYMAVFKGRMVVATATRLYWSQLLKYEAFNHAEFLDVAPQNGQEITGLQVDALNPSTLLVFKETSTYALVGESPGSWTLSLLNGSIGCVGHRTIREAGGALWWWSRQGPIRLSSAGFERLAKGRIDDQLGPDLIAEDHLWDAAHTWFDEPRDRIVFWIPSYGSSVATIGYAYNLTLDCWEGLWTGPAWTATVVSVDASEQPLSHALQAYNVRWYKHDLTVGADGTEASGTYSYSGSFTAAAGPFQELLTTGAQMPASGSAGLLLTILDSTGETEVGTVLIVSHVAQLLTFGLPVAGITEGVTYTWQVGAVRSSAASAWFDAGDPWTRKRLEYAYMAFRGGNELPTSTLAIHTDFNTTTALRSWTLAASDAMSTWDSAIWDAGNWAGRGGARAYRLRIAGTGRCWQFRWKASSLFTAVEWLKAGLRGEVLTDKQ